MPVERYLAELTLTFDVSDDLIIHRKVVNIGGRASCLAP